MSVTVDVNHWWPDFIAATREYQQIRKGYNKELNLSWADLETLRNNRFLALMDEETCARWEAMLGIKPEPDASLEARRREISMMVSTSRPYTKKKLREILGIYLGADGYTMTIDTAAKTVVIDLKTAGRAQYIYDRVRQIIPADMQLLVGDRYNRHQKLAEHTHNALHAYTHADLRGDTSIFG